MLRPNRIRVSWVIGAREVDWDGPGSTWFLYVSFLWVVLSLDDSRSTYMSLSEVCARPSSIRA